MAGSKDNKVPVIKFGSDEHEQLIAPSYGFTLEEAKATVAERLKNHMSVPYDVFLRAKGMISAMTSTPKVTAYHKHPLSHGNG